MPLFQPFQAGVGQVGDQLQRVAGALRRGGIGVVEHDAAAAEVFARHPGLGDAQLSQRRIAPALDLVPQVEHRLAVAHQVKDLFHTIPAFSRFLFACAGRLCAPAQNAGRAEIDDRRAGPACAFILIPAAGAVKPGGARRKGGRHGPVPARVPLPGQGRHSEIARRPAHDLLRQLLSLPGAVRPGAGPAGVCARHHPVRRQRLRQDHRAEYYG